MMIHKIYAQMSEEDRIVVDEIFRDASASLKAVGIPSSNSDPGERLVEAIAVFIDESRREDRWRKS